MAVKVGSGSAQGVFAEKKSRQGKGKYTKWPGMGSGQPGGGRVSKAYRKKYRGQGK